MPIADRNENAPEMQAPATEATPATKRPRKLERKIEGSILIFTFAELGTSLTCDISTLSDEIKHNLMMHGANQKIGDAAAGQDGPDIEAAVTKVWDGLQAGDWTVRAPAAPKVSKKAISEKLDAMDEATREAAKATLAALGITL